MLQQRRWGPGWGLGHNTSEGHHVRAFDEFYANCEPLQILLWGVFTQHGGLCPGGDLLRVCCSRSEEAVQRGRWSLEWDTAPHSPKGMIASTVLTTDTTLPCNFASLSGWLQVPMRGHCRGVGGGGGSDGSAERSELLTESSGCTGQRKLPLGFWRSGFQRGVCSEKRASNVSASL